MTKVYNGASLIASFEDRDDALLYIETINELLGTKYSTKQEVTEAKFSDTLYLSGKF